MFSRHKDKKNAVLIRTRWIFLTYTNVLTFIELIFISFSRCKEAKEQDNMCTLQNKYIPYILILLVALIGGAIIALYYFLPGQKVEVGGKATTEHVTQKAMVNKTYEIEKNSHFHGYLTEIFKNQSTTLELHGNYTRKLHLKNAKNQEKITKLQESNYTMNVTIFTSMGIVIGLFLLFCIGITAAVYFKYLKQSPQTQGIQIFTLQGNGTNGTERYGTNGTAQMVQNDENDISMEHIVPILGDKS